MVLGILRSHIGVTKKTKTSETDLARKILVFIQQNYLENLTIESLYRQFGYSKDYLSRFFNSYLGCGFNRYINSIRSHHAAQMISESKQSLTQISCDSRFGNYRTFNRAFFSVYGVTPSDYKKYREKVV